MTLKRIKTVSRVEQIVKNIKQLDFTKKTVQIDPVKIRKHRPISPLKEEMSLKTGQESYEELITRAPP